MYRIIVDGFQKEFGEVKHAIQFGNSLFDAGLWKLNADDIRKGKGAVAPTVFVKNHTADTDDLNEASKWLAQLADVFKYYEVNPAIKLITIKKEA